MNDTVSSDFQRAEFTAIPLTLGILLVVFGAAVAAAIPLLLGLSAVMATLGLLAIPSQLVPVDEASASIILLIGLAVGVDYSLFYLKREREERAAGRGSEAALEAAAATSGRAVLISGLTVIVALAGLFFGGTAIWTSIAIGTIMVVAIAVARLADRAPGAPLLARRPRREGQDPLPAPRRASAAATPASGARSSTASSAARSSRPSPRRASSSPGPPGLRDAHGLLRHLDLPRRSRS